MFAVKEKTSKRPIRRGIIAAAIIAVAIIAFGFGKLSSLESKTEKTELEDTGELAIHENETTKIGFEDIGELATHTMYCTQVNVTEASRDLWGVQLPFTQSKYIYSYGVIIKAGFDFGDIEWTVDDASSTIKVELPEVRILSSEIDTDSFKLYHEKESVFRQISLGEHNQALAALEKTAQDNAIANGLLDNARSNAETILTLFFANEYDLKTYKIEFIDKQ